MDQERAAHQLKEFFKLTGELFLKGLYHASQGGVTGFEHYLMSKTNRPMLGEQDWDKFMASPDQKELKTFYAQELNVEQLKAYLKDYGIGFALKEGENHRMKLVFHAKDQALVTQAFDDLVKDLTTPDKAQDLTKKLLKTPKNMSFEEKLAYQTAKVKDTIQLAKATQAPRKAVKNEVVKS